MLVVEHMTEQYMILCGRGTDGNEGVAGESPQFGFVNHYEYVILSPAFSADAASFVKDSAPASVESRLAHGFASGQATF
jgi:hypothetical protein